MWKELQELADTLGLSTGQVLLIAGELTGNRNMRTTDLLTRNERVALIAELKRLLAEDKVIESFSMA